MGRRVKSASYSNARSAARFPTLRWLWTVAAVGGLLIVLPGAMSTTRAGETAGVPQQVVDPNKEYNLKAVFLYSFGRYITWNRWSDSAGDFQIGVLGDSPIIEPVREIAAKRTLNGRRLHVEAADASQEVSNYQLLFISRAVPIEQVEQALQSVSADTIVVVERDDLFELGASILFFIDGTSVRFELNRQNLQNKNVQLDAKLLRLSRARR